MSDLSYSDWVAVGGGCVALGNHKGMYEALDGMTDDAAAYVLALLAIGSIDATTATDMMATIILRGAFDMLNWRGHVAMC